MPSPADVPGKIQSLAEQGIVETDIVSGLVYGTTYIRQQGHNGKGVLLVHGQSGNRYGLAILAYRLAIEGYCCLSIDLPSHYKNPNPLRLSIISETVMAAVGLLETQFQVEHVVVIGHSLGAAGSLFASAGYTTNVEEQLYTTGEKLCSLLQNQTKLLSRSDETSSNQTQFAKLDQDIDTTYDDLKAIAIGAMKEGLTMRLRVRGYIFLAPPRNIKSAYPATTFLKSLPPNWLKLIGEYLLHKPAIATIQKEGNVVKYEPEQDSTYYNMQFFKTKEVYAFLEYISAVREPVDFIELLETISQLKQRDGKTNLMEYYYKQYIGQAPKLFIYGKYDMLLRPFLPFQKQKLEKFYKSCNNAEIMYGSFSHVIVEDAFRQTASVAVRNDAVISRIITFLDSNLRLAR